MNIQRTSAPATRLHRRNYMNINTADDHQTTSSPIISPTVINTTTASSSNNNINMLLPQYLIFHSNYLNTASSDHPQDFTLPITTSCNMKFTSSCSWESNGSAGDSFDVENLHTLFDLLDDPPHNSFLQQDKIKNLECFPDDDIIPNLDDIIGNNIIELDWPSRININEEEEGEMKINNNSLHKQRIRWTTELHDLFLDAIQTLGGPEFATPKKILGIMNVKGLSIYHVKSHLQKYRLAKNNAPDVKHERKDCTSSTENENKKDNSSSSDNMPVTEALRVQIELQKLLHDQLKAHRELQVSIEQNAEFLRKLIEKQQNIPNNESKPKADHHHSSSSSPIIINDSSDSN